jgi:hypothetical protein
MVNRCIIYDSYWTNNLRGVALTMYNLDLSFLNHESPPHCYMKVLVFQNILSSYQETPCYLFNCFGLHCCEKIWPKAVSDAEDFGGTPGNKFCEAKIILEVDLITKH